MQRDSKQREALMEQSTKQTFELRRQFTEGTERAAAIADCARSESERYGLWAYSAWVVPLETAPAYDFLRDDPAFQSLLARHRPARTP